jgi:glutathione peroxidase
MFKAFLAVGILSLAAVVYLAIRSSGSKHPPTGAASPLEFTLTANDGTPHPLSQYRGKVVMLVNTASRCGFTKQYSGLQQLWQTYGGQGLVIIGIPSNDFMGQDPGSDGEIRDFCSRSFGVTFPLMSKAIVKGKDQIPLYRYLTAESPKPGGISWNFAKFLIGRDGQVINRFAPTTSPDSKDMVAAIEAALATPASLSISTPTAGL